MAAAQLDDVRAFAGMYHVELRQFPHNRAHFNLSERDIGGLAVAWVKNQAIEVGERRWLPQQAKLTILEGPELPVAQLTMGRGWTAAQRQGQEVTERVLADARRRVSGVSPGAGPGPVGITEGPAGDAPALGVQLGQLLGADPASLLAAWRAVVAEHPGLAPGESLTLAERRLAAPGADNG